MDTFSHIVNNKIVAIIRGAQPADVLPIVQALYKGGIRSVEITLNSKNALEAIKAASATMGTSMMVGAGTVITSEEAAKAIEAGARFIISPIVDEGVITTTKKLGALSIPGAYTPTEIVLASRLGADIIKVFPASIGPAYIKDVLGPLSHIPLMPTGGVTLQNIGAFKQAGAVAFGIGSALVNSANVVTGEYLEQLSATAAQFVEAVM